MLALFFDNKQYVLMVSYLHCRYYIDCVTYVQITLQTKLKQRAVLGVLETNFVFLYEWFDIDVTPLIRPKYKLTINSKLNQETGFWPTENLRD